MTNKENIESDAEVFANQMISDCVDADQTPEECYGEDISNRLRKYATPDDIANLWMEKEN